MKIILSPAKKMVADTDSLEWRDLPQFLGQTEQILAALRALSDAQRQKLWQCNDQLAALNSQRLRDMDLRRRLTPAILCYEGIQYQYMAPDVFTYAEFDYIQAHLRILSGFYGLLRPFDGVTPYRLEMQARLAVNGARNLYAFWGDALAKALAETECVINLASKEYSVCISRHLPPSVRFITCVFGEEKDGRVIEKATLCKMARGEMVRYMAERQIQRPEDIRSFDRLQFRYAPAYSDESTYVFVRGKTAPRG